MGKKEKLNEMLSRQKEARFDFARLGVNKIIFWLFRLNDIKISMLNLSNIKFGKIDTSDLLNEFPRFNLKNILNSVFVANIYKQKLDEYQKIVNDFKQNLGLENSMAVRKNSMPSIDNENLDFENINYKGKIYNNENEKEKEREREKKLKTGIKIINVEGRLNKDKNKHDESLIKNLKEKNHIVNNKNKKSENVNININTGTSFIARGEKEN